MKGVGFGVWGLGYGYGLGGLEGRLHGHKPRFARKLVLGSLEVCLGISNPHTHNLLYKKRMIK